MRTEDGDILWKREWGSHSQRVHLLEMAVNKLLIRTFHKFDTETAAHRVLRFFQLSRALSPQEQHLIATIWIRTLADITTNAKAEVYSRCTDLFNRLDQLDEYELSHPLLGPNTRAVGPAKVSPEDSVRFARMAAKQELIAKLESQKAALDSETASLKQKLDPRVEETNQLVSQMEQYADVFVKSVGSK